MIPNESETTLEILWNVREPTWTTRTREPAGDPPPSCVRCLEPDCGATDTAPRSWCRACHSTRIEVEPA